MNGTSTPADPAVETARHFIHAHLREPLTLDTIAMAAAVSPPHLIRLFRQQLNTTPMAYLWERRVAQGIDLLRQTGLSVGEIATRCGFQTSYHFSTRAASDGAFSYRSATAVMGVPLRLLGSDRKGCPIGYCYEQRDSRTAASPNHQRERCAKRLCNPTGKKIAKGGQS